MAKIAAKPGSIPSYQEELEKLSAELKAAEEQRAHLEAQWRQKYMPDVEELIEFARRRKHPWAEKIEPENEGIVKETFLVWLYRSTSEQRKIRALETDIEDLKLRITAFLEKGEPLRERSPQHSVSTKGLGPCASQPGGPFSSRTAVGRLRRCWAS